MHIGRNRFVAAFALGALIFGSVCFAIPAVRAQDSGSNIAVSATPNPHPQIYDDAAMHFEAPADFKLLGMRTIALKDLQQPTTIAAWVKLPGDPNQRVLSIIMEPYHGDANGYEETVESELRDQGNDLLVDHKEATATANGMPAYLIAFSFGTGFDAKKEYELIWSDGVRGVAIGLIGPTGEVTENDAKAAFKNVRAVLYPAGRE